MRLVINEEQLVQPSCCFHPGILLEVKGTNREASKWHARGQVEETRSERLPPVDEAKIVSTSRLDTACYGHKVFRRRIKTHRMRPSKWMLRDGQMDGGEAGLLESCLLEGSPRDKLSLARNRWTLHDVSGP
jgi:hypothetical protein